MNDVTCRTFIERIDDLLEGRLDPAERQAAEEHLRSCAGCREIEGLAAGAGAPVAPPAGLLGAVLALTSGPACGSARARLCDHVDRLLAPVDAEMMQMHLDGCGECGRLAAALARLATDLPPLADLDPGARFLPDVVDRTSRRAPLPVRWTIGLAAAWRQLAHRPRIAWEGAYALSIILAILFGTPNAPFAGVPARALDLVRTVQESLPAEAAGEGVPRIRHAVRSRWTETKAGVQDATRDVAADLKRRSAAAWDGLKEELGTVRERIASQKSTNDTSRTSDAGDGNEGER